MLGLSNQIRAFEGLRPSFSARYALANLGHPSRTIGRGLEVGTSAFWDTCPDPLGLLANRFLIFSLIAKTSPSRSLDFPYRLFTNEHSRQLRVFRNEHNLATH